MPRKSAATPAAARDGARAKAAPVAEAKKAKKTKAEKTETAAKASASAKAPATAKAAPAKTVRVKTPARAAASTTAPARPARKSPARTNLKSAIKAAAGALAGPAPTRSRRAAQPAAKPVPETRDAVRPVLVRDSFTMPEQEYAVLAEVKGACLRAGIDVKKSELLRIGVALLGQVDIATLKAVLAALPQLKTGRPPAA